MKDRMLKHTQLTVDGVLSIDSDGQVYISVADKGDFLLSELLATFNGKLVEINCSYDEHL